MKRSLRALRSAARRPGAVLTALVVVAAGTAFAVAESLPPAAAPKSPRTTAAVSSQFRAELDALQQAMLTGRAVTVSSLTTEVSQTVANPNGTLINTDYVEPVRVRQDGAWHPVSAALHHDASGSWEPQAVPSGVTLSGGGAGPLATLTSVTGERLSLSFPGRLRAPVVSGATATYKSVWPGTDLQVTVDTLGGLTWTVIARNAAAAANPALRNLQLAVSGQDLTVRTDQTGNLSATGPGGTAQFSGPPAMIWDSGARAQPSSRHIDGAPEKSTASAPGRAARVAVVRGRLTGRALRLTPAASILSRTSSYPLYLSASIAPDATVPRGAAAAAAGAGAGARERPDASTALACDTVENQNEACVTGNGFAEVQKSCAGDTNYGTAQGETGYQGNGIGYQQDNPCAGVYRSFYQFDTSDLITTLATAPTAKLWVQSATLDAWVNYSADWGCKAKWPVYLDWSGPISKTTDWTNQPGADANDQQKSATTTPGPNPSSACTQQEVAFNVAYAITDTVGSGADNITFRLSGDESPTDTNGNTSETTDNGFMRIGDNPNILTVFDLNPPTPTNLQTFPAAAYEPGGPDSYGCGQSSSNLPWVSMTDLNQKVSQFNLSAGISQSITTEPVRAGYKMWDNGTAITNPAGTDDATPPNPGMWSNWETVAVTTNTQINFPLLDGHQYTWTAQAFVDGIPQGSDPGYWSTAAPTCGFNVDLQAPKNLLVSSATFPRSGTPDEQPPPADTSGTFSFSATDPAPTGCGSCQASGVYEFRYALNRDEDTLATSENTTQLGCGSANATYGVVKATASAATSCPITPTQWGTNILYVAAVDKAGNVSTVATYYFYVPWNPNLHPVPGDINGPGNGDGDGVPDLLATGTPTTSTDLTLFQGNTDLALDPSTTSTASAKAASPDGTSWSNYQITHRGPVSQVSASANVDDLYAHKNGGASLYLYKNNPSDPGVSPQFGDTSAIAAIQRPLCPGCSGYSSDWSDVSQILAPGDAWNPTPAATGSASTADTGQPSLLTVEHVNGNYELWLFQGNYAPGLQDPVELSSDWSNDTLVAPGYVDGRLTIWAYNPGDGNLDSYPVYIVNQVPSLSASSNAPIAAESGTLLFTYPYYQSGVAVASSGPIDMTVQSNETDVPGLFIATPPPTGTLQELYQVSGTGTGTTTDAPADPAERVSTLVEGSAYDPDLAAPTTCANGCLWYYPGEENAGVYTLPATITPNFVGDLPTPVQALS